MSYLNSPPATPDSSFCLESAYKSLDIKFINSPMMPNPSKVKLNGPFSWEETRQIVANNQLELFARSQEETNRYLVLKHELKQRNQDIMTHVLVNELGWSQQKLDEDNANRAGKIFVDADTLKIIYNQFPYYFPKNVVHLCVWSSVVIPTDPNSKEGDITEETRRIIDKYVSKTFTEKYNLHPDQICWFKNWGLLQSIKNISHIHVLIEDFDVEKYDILGSPGEPLLLEEIEEAKKI